MNRASSGEVLAGSILALLLFLTPSISTGQELDLEFGDFLNVQLADVEADYRVHAVETYTYSDQIGRTVFFSDRTKQLAAHFVPGDPRRAWFFPPEVATGITSITDAIEGSTSSGLTAADTTTAISAAMDTWNSVKSTHIPITDYEGFLFDFGVVQFQVTGGTAGFRRPVADITHAGFLPREFFDAIAPPNGGDFILGATFTFIFIDGQQNPTDVDNDGKIDVAFRETYYNDDFFWRVDSAGGVDVESVALHEAGHALSQGHFGVLFRTERNGKFHFAPRAVMNAGYTGVQRELSATDLGGHSSIWGSWPLR